MCRIGYEHLAALVVAARQVTRTDHEDTGQLALRASGGLQRDAGQAADLAEILLQLEHQLDRALHGLRFLIRMD